MCFCACVSQQPLDQLVAYMFGFVAREPALWASGGGNEEGLCIAQKSEKSGCPQNSYPQIRFYPPPLEKAQNEEKLHKSVENPQIDTSSGGGGNAILWTKQVYGHLGVSDKSNIVCQDVGCKPSLRSHGYVL